MKNNIYKVAREIVNMSLEEAEKLLCISSTIINEYEISKKIPSEEIVNNMVVVYKAPWLACLHFMFVEGIEGVDEIIYTIIKNNNDK